MPQIISDPANISVDWLNEILQCGGIDGKITDFSAERIGTGQVGENVRFALSGTDVPGTIVGKFPSSDPVSKQTGIDLGNYVREVFFYQQLQSTVDIQTPQVLFADADQETHEFVIMMEDLAPGRQGDQLAGCSVDEAALALEQLARLQGPRWGDERLLEFPLLVGTSQDPGALQTLYQSLEPGFLARYESYLNGEEVSVVSKVGESLDTYNDIYKGPPCLIHIDYRLDNMMFGGPYPLAVVDWQSLSTGCPVADASYFLGTSLPVHARREEERALLRHYLDVLAGYGVEFTEDECYACYRNYAPAGLIMAVIASMLVSETERGNEMFMAMAKRSARMCLDLS